MQKFLKELQMVNFQSKMKDIDSDFRKMSYEHKLDSGYTQRSAKGILEYIKYIKN